MLCDIRLIQNDADKMCVYCITKLIHDTLRLNALWKFMQKLATVLTMANPRSQDLRCKALDPRTLAGSRPIDLRCIGYIG